MEQAAALIQSRSYSASYNLPQNSKRRKTKIGTESTTFMNGKDGQHTKSEEEGEGQVLMFHGIILRSQLVEMLKNKIFFDENDGVSDVNVCALVFISPFILSAWESTTNDILQFDKGLPSLSLCIWMFSYWRGEEQAYGGHDWYSYYAMLVSYFVIL